MFLKSFSRQTRDVIIHAHIFKNAGTTIDWILEQNFGSQFLDDRNDQQMRQDAEYLSQTILKKRKLRALSSHSMPLPVSDIPGIRLHNVVMLRHPLLRIRSVYDFEHKQKAETPGAIHAKKYNFADYVAWRMQPGIAPTIRNMQTRYLTHNSQPRVEELTKQHYLSAVEFIQNNPLIGLVEQFDKSMVVFQESLQKAFPDIQLCYQKQNVTDKKKLSAQEKIDQLQTDLGPELFAELIDKNQIDIQLYEAANELLEQRFNQIDNADIKLSDLRLQCEKL